MPVPLPSRERGRRCSRIKDDGIASSHNPVLIEGHIHIEKEIDGALPLRSAEFDRGLDEQRRISAGIGGMEAGRTRRLVLISGGLASGAGVDQFDSDPAGIDGADAGKDSHSARQENVLAGGRMEHTAIEGKERGGLDDLRAGLGGNNEVKDEPQGEG